MRPDILLVDNAPLGRIRAVPQPGDEPWCPEPSPNRVVHIIELGYCWDLQHARKREEKKRQHMSLVAALLAHGWKVEEHIITLGATGTIPNDLHAIMRDLRVPACTTRDCARKLHQHALHTATDIIAVRRMMERGQPCTNLPPRPP